MVEIEGWFKKYFENKNIKEAVDVIFDHFYGLFPSTYSIFKTEEALECAKFSWEIAFKLSGIANQIGKIDIDLLYRGFSLLGCLNQKFMPSCGQFIDLCIKGLPEKNVEI